MPCRPARLSRPTRQIKLDSLLAADKAIAAFLKHGDPARKLELHASQPIIDALTDGAAPDPAKLKAASSLSSGSFSLEMDRFEVNVFLPVAELKEMVKRHGW